MRKSMIALIALSGVAVGVAAAQVGGHTKLTGFLSITGEYAIDPPPDQKIDRVGIHLTGEAAKRVYDAMPAKAERDSCDDGMRTKRAGSLSCFSDNDQRYGCMIAVLLASGETRPYGAC
jgi:hypothetical protein